MKEPMHTPGEVSFWLARASLDDLHRARFDEVQNPMTARWALVLKIDEELARRDALLRKAFEAQ